MKTLDANEQKGVLITVLWKVVPPACAALLVIWLLVGAVGAGVLKQRDVESLEAAAEQQAWTVADNIADLFDGLHSIANNALTINAFMDPLAVEHYLQPFFRSFRIGHYTSLSVTMKDFSGAVMVSTSKTGQTADLPPDHLWLEPAMKGRDILAVVDGRLIAAVPVSIGSLPEGSILAVLSPEDTRALLSSAKHEGEIRLLDSSGQTLITVDNKETASPAAMIETSVDLTGFPGLTLQSAIPAYQDTQLLGVLHGFLFTAFLGNLAALVLGIFMAANLVASPLNRLVMKIQSMQKLSDTHERLAVEGPLEMRNLARAFNDAADRQAGLTTSLEDALAREKDHNEKQRQFVSLVSHEFRTPLAIIDGQAQRIIRKADRETPEKIADAMRRCRSSVGRLIGLIESVLSSSRLDAGAIAFNPGPCQLNDMLTEIATNQESINSTHRILLDIDRLPAEIVADEKLLRQVFTNLMSNAVKYSPNATTVWVRGYQADAETVVAVHDKGVGIPEKEIEKLFSRYFRATTATGIPGTGIGLHLVKHLVEMHDGQVSVQSSPDEGTTFTVRIPSERAPMVSSEAA